MIKINKIQMKLKMNNRQIKKKFIKMKMNKMMQNIKIHFELKLLNSINN